MVLERHTVGTHAIEAGLYMVIDIPFIGGHHHSSWRMLEDDHALLFGWWKHGYKRFDKILGDSMLWLNRFEDAEARLHEATGKEATNMKTKEA
jgi:hypothetical protein